MRKTLPVPALLAAPGLTACSNMGAEAAPASAPDPKAEHVPITITSGARTVE